MADAFEEFGPYAVYERLGQGGMATVHRAEKRGVGFRRPIALKRLLPHVAADPALVKLFVDEARLASHLRHANVAQTYELGKVGDTFFIAMEYASGPTLAQIIRQCQHAAGDLPLPISVNILHQVCEALDYAHNLCDDTGQPLRIIHRDVSPPNIIVTNTGTVKLIDFGIAKATISSVKTQTGFIKGKFGYIAPEYITGQIDTRVDLFAVGVVAHEMLSGRRLFEGKDDFETLQNIRDMNLEPPSRWNRQVTPDLDDVVMTALQRDPARRWQTAGAMQLALANIARSFGRVVANQQLAMWVDWAFSQRRGADRAADLAGDTSIDSSGDATSGGDTTAGGDTDAFGPPSPDPDTFGPPSPDPDAFGPPTPDPDVREFDPDSSVSIEISRFSASVLDGAAGDDEPAPPPEPTARATTLHDRPTRVAPVPVDPRRKPPSLQPAPSARSARPQPSASRSPAPRAQPSSSRAPSPPPSASRAPSPQPSPSRSPAPRSPPSSSRAPSPPPSASRAPSPQPSPSRSPPAPPQPAAARAPSPRPSSPRAAAPRPSGMRSPSDSAETLPVERFVATAADLEALAPSPALPSTPFPRASRTHTAVSSASAATPAAVPPSLAHPRPSRSMHAVIPPPLPGRPSQAVDAASPPAAQRTPRPMLPFAAPTQPRPSPTHDPLASSPLASAPPPALPPSSSIALLSSTLLPSRRDLEALGPPPPVAASQELDVLPRPAPRAPQVEAAMPAAPPAPPPDPAAPVAGNEVKRATRSRHRSTKQVRPSAGSSAEAAAATSVRAAAASLATARSDVDTAPVPRRRRHVLWLILLMSVLGAAAMAAAYYWPEG